MTFLTSRSSHGLASPPCLWTYPMAAKSLAMVPILEPDSARCMRKVATSAWSAGSGQLSSPGHAQSVMYFINSKPALAARVGSGPPRAVDTGGRERACPENGRKRPPEPRDP